MKYEYVGNLSEDEAKEFKLINLKKQAVLDIIGFLTEQYYEALNQEHTFFFKIADKCGLPKDCNYMINNDTKGIFKRIEE